MQKDLRPYIGVSGITAIHEISELLEYFSTDSTVRLMAGVLANKKTLGNKRQDSAIQNRYPLPGEEHYIFMDDPRVLNLIHYGAANTANLHQDLRMVRIGFRRANGIQLNVVWPNPEEIQMYKEMYQKDTIVLQIGPRALQKIDHSQQALAEMLKVYEPIVDYFLLDPSDGQGKSFDMKTLKNYLEATRDISILPAVAGGLNHRNVRELRELVQTFGISIDAESGLRDADDFLNPVLAKKYIQRALPMYENSVPVT